MADLPIPQIKNILRACNIEPVHILGAKTKPELVELAESLGIIMVPEEWTMDKIRQEQARRKEVARAKLTVAGLAQSVFSHRGAADEWRGVHAPTGHDDRCRRLSAASAQQTRRSQAASRR